MSAPAGEAEGFAGAPSPAPLSMSDALPVAARPRAASPWAEALFEQGCGIDVLIPTLNEAGHIDETVRNAREVGRVWVLDSFSRDGTQALAQRAGAAVVEHRFVDYAKQKNWGLEHLPFEGRWVFILDADERVTPALREELFTRAARPRGAEGFYVNRVVIYMGAEIRHGGLYPSWNLRFFRRGRCRYEDRAVHEHMVCDGPTEYLSEEMLHIRREPLAEWIRKHINYAHLESEEWLKLRAGQPAGERPEKLFRDSLKYRWWLRREVWPRTPFRPLLRFIYMYFVRLGVLDGRPGLRLAAMTACYEYMIGLMYREKLARQRAAGGRADGAGVASAAAGVPAAGGASA